MKNSKQLQMKINHIPYANHSNGVPELCLVSIKLPKGKVHGSVQMISNIRPSRIEIGILRHGIMHWFASALSCDHVLMYTFTQFVEENDVLQVYRMGSSATDVEGLVSYYIR
jgi:hypothetical protein